jgi:hypothetical protein
MKTWRCKRQREDFALTGAARGTIEPIHLTGSGSRPIEAKPSRHILGRSPAECEDRVDGSVTGS